MPLKLPSKHKSLRELTVLELPHGSWFWETIANPKEFCYPVGQMIDVDSPDYPRLAKYVCLATSEFPCVEPDANGIREYETEDGVVKMRERSVSDGFPVGGTDLPPKRYAKDPTDDEIVKQTGFSAQYFKHFEFPYSYDEWIESGAYRTIEDARKDAKLYSVRFRTRIVKFSYEIVK